MRTITTAILLTLSTAANSSVQWDNAELSSNKVSIEGESLKGKGLSFTKAVGDVLFVAAKNKYKDSEVYRGYSIDSKIETNRFGIGFKNEVSENTELFFLLSYIDVKHGVSVPRMNYNASLSESGNSMILGVKSRVSDSIQLTSYIDRAKIDEATNSFNLGIDFFITNQISIGAGYSKDSDINIKGMNIRYIF